ncbi:MAG: GTPase [Planctomycetota bacterium]|jgi:tRNA modification GTPase
MCTFAAVMTSKGTGAISTIQLYGNSAKDIIKKIFKPDKEKKAILQPGRIHLGNIFDAKENLDQVTIGCVESNNFSINCHGNPLIVSDIIKLLADNKVQLVNAEQLLSKIYQTKKQFNTIAIEAKFEVAKASTIEGTKIINNQVKKGLVKIASAWLQKKDTIKLEEIKTEAEKILQNSQTGKLIIFGCKAVIVGPPNSGKSTLLNSLAGKEKAVVTDIKGTTRDWVSAQCRIGPLPIEFIDTAGLGEELIETEIPEVDKASQLKSLELLEEADLLLLVLDINQHADQLQKNLAQKIGGKKVLTVLNKSDLHAKLDMSKLPPNFHDYVSISAKNRTGLDKLFQKILVATEIEIFDLFSPVCFTRRQEILIHQISSLKSKEQALSIITELLNGDVSV